MNPDCVSLEVSRKLKDAGWPQAGGSNRLWVTESGEGVPDFMRCSGVIWSIAAPTLGEMFAWASQRQMNVELNMHYEAGASATVWYYQNEPKVARYPKVPNADRPTPADAFGLAIVERLKGATP